MTFLCDIRVTGAGARQNASREAIGYVPVLLFLYFPCFQAGRAPVMGRTGLGVSAWHVSHICETEAPVAALRENRL
jgi:hypothetical protein